MKIWIESCSDLDRYPEYDKFSGEEFTTELFKEMLHLSHPIVFRLVTERDTHSAILPKEAAVGDVKLSHPIDW